MKTPHLVPRREGVVVVVNGSAASDVALRFASAEAARRGEQVRAIRAWQPPPVWIDASVPDPDYLRSLEEMYTHVLDDAVQEVMLQYPNLNLVRSVVEASAHAALIDAARTAALLVVGNHGSRGLRRLLLGSVSHSVILNAQSPVVVVRAD